MNVPPPHAIVQIQDGSDVACDGYYGLPNNVPAYIALVTDGSMVAAREASRLRLELRRQLTALPGARVELSDLPCDGRRADFHCSAINRDKSQNVLVFLSDGTSPPWPHPSVVMPMKLPRVLVLLAPGAPEPVVPWATPRTNVAHWVHHAAEFVPNILAAAGLTTSEARIFISYRRKETSALAEQLFDALGRRNFDVFVDRFRIDVGADFQQRILQELAHKSMVVYLESQTILKSKWTRYEINVAKSARLGVLALHLPSGQRIREIDDSRREYVHPRSDGTLDDAALASVVERIVTEHSLSHLRRRRLLRENMQRALRMAKVFSQSIEDGAILVTPNAQSSKTYLVWLPSRPAEMADFHFVATTSPSQSGVRTIIAPANHLVGDERQRIRWLAQTSDVRSFDESQMLQVARAMQQEAL